MRLIAPVLGCAVAVLLAQTAVAGPSGQIGDEGVGASAGVTTTTDVPTSTIPPEVCAWGADQVHYQNGRVEEGGFVYMFIDLMYWRFRPSTGEVWVQAWRTCRRGDEVTFDGVAWRRVSDPDPGVLAESLYDEVTRQVPLPSPAMSPNGPGFVNLGMWLAVQEQAPISATATAGPVWATTTAELVSTTFDLGNGDVVTCDGVGDPIPPSMTDTVEESPVCGYTYLDRSPDGGFVVTITSTWRVWWVGSGGAGGELGTLDRSASVGYEVLEIQTVGTG